MDASGRLVIRGRWFGVRGRRFVRPALIVHGPGTPERRVLAELEDKPWAAEDGEAWRATFTLDSALGEAGALELSVAPDIIVTLQPTAGPQRARTVERRPRTRARTRAETPQGGGEPGGGAGVDAPRDRAESPRPSSEPRTRPGAGGRALEPQRLAVRLTSAERALEREQERRAEAELALERQRTEARELSSELGRASAELALARAAEREARATADLLDLSRRDGHAAQTRYDALAAEHERTLRTQERLHAELDVRTEELTAAQEAMAGAEPPAGAAGAPGLSNTDRPLNPSLRSHGWVARLIAVVVLAAVVFAVYLILHSTVLR